MLSWLPSCGDSFSKNKPERVAATFARIGGNRAPHARRLRARMTVLADHGAPLGVSTPRALSSAAAARADILANSARTGAMARALATESRAIRPA
jgi:hypothetical protein